MSESRSPMGQVLSTLGGGHVFVMLRESEVGYQMITDPRDPTGKTALGPAIGDQKIVFDAVSYREFKISDDSFPQSDVWEFTVNLAEMTSAGPIQKRSHLYIRGSDILFVRAPSALA